MCLCVISLLALKLPHERSQVCHGIVSARFDDVAEVASLLGAALRMLNRLENDETQTFRGARFYGIRCW